MTDAPQPPPGWHPPNPPTSPPPPPPTSPGGYPPPPPPSSPPGWAAPTTPPPPTPPPPPAPGVPGSTLPPPPGTPGYGYGYTPVGGQARPLGGVATALTILLGIAAAVSLLVTVAFFNRASLLDDPFSLTQQEADDADGLVAASFGFYFLVAIAVIVLWLVWQFRHAKNAEALGKREGLGAGWAIGGWFIPVANLVLGPLQLLQSAKWSDTSAQPGQGRAPGSLVLWWVLFVAQGLFGFAGGFQPDEANTFSELEDLQSQDQVAGIGALVTAAAAVAAIVMVRQVTQRQRDALRQRGLAA